LKLFKEQRPDDALLGHRPIFPPLPENTDRTRPDRNWRLRNDALREKAE